MGAMRSQAAPNLQRRSLLGWVSLGLVLIFVTTVLFMGLPSQTRWMALASILATAGVVVWAALQARRDRRHHERELARHAAAEAVARQRLELARELHDSISHRLGAITMRAALAQRMPDKMPPSEALPLIEELSRSATDDLRRVLDALGDDETPDASLDLDQAMEAAERAGLSIEFHHDPPDPLPSPVAGEISALVREALGNTVRHAGPTQVAVSILTADGAVQVRVLDEGPRTEWHGASGTGRGLASLRERFSALGGQVEYGRTPEGGWLVQGRLPRQGAAA